MTAPLVLRLRFSAALLGACFAVCVEVRAADIANAEFSVTCSGGTFSVTDRASGKTAVKQGQLDGVDASAVPREEAAKDAVFGAGRRLAFTRKAADGTGGVVSLETYPGLPFVLVRETVTNTTDKPVDLQKVVPAVFTLDLGKPAAELKTMGTGGLLAPDKNPGSYLFLTTADPISREGVVSGWVTQKKGSGSAFSSVKEDKVEIKAQLEHGHLILAPGKSATLDTFAIGYFTDARLGEEALASAIAKAHDIKLRPKQATYMSWYAEGPGHGRAGNEQTTVELAKFCAKERLPEFGLGVLQMDDGWQDGPQINGPARHFDRLIPNGPYKGGIAPVAKEVDAHGMVFGLWWMPFSRNHMEPDFKDKQDWFWKRPDGTPLRQNAFGGTCLDSSHPAVAQDIEKLARLLRSWGVKYYKMDGFSTGAGVDQIYINDGYKDDGFGKCQPAHDPTLTNIEVMRKGIGLIRKGAGNDVFFSGCATTQNMRIYAGSIGLVDAMRVGPDFNHDGQGIRSGVLRGSRLYFLNGKVWWNDPDPAKVRTSNEANSGDSSNSGAVSTDQARLTTSWVAITDQFYLLSDWLPNLTAERIDILKRTMASHGATTRPVDYFDSNLANTWLATSEKSGVRRDVVGIFNYYEQPLKAEYSFPKVGLDASATYHAFDYWENKPVADISGTIKAELPPMSCRVLSLRAKEDHPVLVSTSRHVSSGILEVEKESWKDDVLSGTSKVIGGDAYELRTVGLRDGGKQWKPMNPDVSAQDKAAGVTISSAVEAGLLRVKIVSPVSRSVDWRVRFDSSKALQPEHLSDLKAEAPAVYQPVKLVWKSNASFHTITRDGQIIATGYFGESYADDGAEPGKKHAYTVAVDGGNAPSTVEVSVPALPPVPPAPTVKLSSLKALEASNGYGGAQNGKSADGGPLTVAKQVCSDGLGLHAPARVVYARDPKWSRFVAHIGLNEAMRADGRTTLVCKVLAIAADGKESVLASSPVMRFNGLESFPVDLALPSDCAKIRLVVEDAGDGIACDHANWGDAGFIE
jgi:hypothetical protein